MGSVREPASKLEKEKLINRLKYSDKICQKCRIQEMEVVTTIEIKGAFQVHGQLRPQLVEIICQIFWVP